ncbi:MAG: RNA polymerase subunit sigma-24, partial [Actinomycetota bacterium]|nr:RNA polymerase subunit sigma-24 [Actinomycetota bacterium]
MLRVDDTARSGLAALRWAVLSVAGVPALAPATGRPVPCPYPAEPAGLLMSEAVEHVPAQGPIHRGDHRPACDDDPEAGRLVGLVDLARGGDSEAFGLLYDHYNGTVYRFLYYRVG